MEIKHIILLSISVLLMAVCLLLPIYSAFSKRKIGCRLNSWDKALMPCNSNESKRLLYFWRLLVTLNVIILLATYLFILSDIYIIDNIDVNEYIIGFSVWLLLILCIAIPILLAWKSNNVWARIIINKYSNNHQYSGCKCTVCNKTRDEEHSWNGCKCTVCNRTRDEHDWNGCTCRNCGEIRDIGHKWHYGTRIVEGLYDRGGSEGHTIEKFTVSNDYETCSICEKIKPLIRYEHG